jgi:hypothetical protein
MTRCKDALVADTLIVGQVGREGCLVSYLFFCRLILGRIM